MSNRIECNCENTGCPHGEKSCGAPNVSGKYRVSDLGTVCLKCGECCDCGLLA